MTDGLSGEHREAFGSLLLSEACLHVRYQYFVTSTLRVDSRILDGAMMGSILFSGGLQKMTQQRDFDRKLLDQLGDVSALASCPHDDLPGSFPVSEDGFDVSYTLLVQEKPADVLDLVVEADSLLRVQIHSDNPKNQVWAFLYQNSSSHGSFAWTEGSRTSSTLLQTIKAQDRAYRLRLEYESLDQDDPCPTLELRVILRPI